jgi:hypothetical protein
MEVYEEGIQKGYEARTSGRITYGKGRFKLSPAYNLFKTLEEFPEFTKEARVEIQNEFEDFPDLKVLNLKVFASVLSFLRKYKKPGKNDELTINLLTDDIMMEYFSRFLPDDKKITLQEKKHLIIRLKAQFLKYIIAIVRYRSNRAFEVEPEEEEEVEEAEGNVEQYEEDD